MDDTAQRIKLVEFFGQLCQFLPTNIEAYTPSELGAVIIASIEREKWRDLTSKEVTHAFVVVFRAGHESAHSFSRFALLLTPVHQPLFLDRINTLVWKSLFQPSSRLYWIGNRPKKELEHDDAIREDVDIVWPYLKGTQKTMP